MGFTYGVSQSAEQAQITLSWQTHDALGGFIYCELLSCDMGEWGEAGEDLWNSATVSGRSGEVTGR